jgi:hypothetical protein
MHLICRARRTASVTATRLPGGAVRIEKTDGPCEDAPCCGCCGEIPPIPDHIIFDNLAALAAVHPDEPIDVAEMDPALFVDGLEVRIPDGIDTTPGRNLADLEIEAESILQVEKKTDGRWCLVAHQETDGIVLTLWEE